MAGPPGNPPEPAWQPNPNPLKHMTPERYKTDSVYPVDDLVLRGLLGCLVVQALPGHLGAPRPPGEQGLNKQGTIPQQASGITFSW